MVNSVDELISVVVPTINKGSRIARTIDSVLANDDPNFDLIVVDQSDDNLSRSSMDPYLTDPRFHYVYIRARGVSLSRNLGVRSTQGELIAFTDDDCTPAGDWLRQMRAAFRRDDRIGMVLGEVVPAAPPSEEGFIAGSRRGEAVLARTIWQRHSIEALAGCMGVRRTVWQALGGLDEMLGSGAPLKSAEENDLATRVLLAGHWIYSTPKVRVTHHGLRRWEESLEVVHDYMFGTGAMLAKLLRRAPGATVKLLGHLALRWVFARKAIEMGWHPPRMHRLGAFLSGFKAGFATPVETSTGHFVRRDLPIRKPPVSAP